MVAQSGQTSQGNGKANGKKRPSVLAGAKLSDPFRFKIHACQEKWKEIDNPGNAQKII